MANRKDYFFRQKVTEAELDAGFDGLEQADFKLAIDNDLVGRMDGMDVSEKSGTPDLTVDVSGPGVSYSKQGERIAFSSLQNVDLSVDDGAVSTAVAAPGNARIVSLFVVFDRLLSDPRIDGNSLTVFFLRDESFDFSVVAGAEATSGSEVPVALDPNKILLADITLIFGQTQIFNADIDATRRESVFKFTAGGITVDEGQVEAALVSVATQAGALATAAPVNVTKAAAVVGVGTTSARDDHKHDVTTAAAVAITDSTNSEGSGTALARNDHGHAHGDRSNGSLHAVAVAGGANGFFEGTDKTKIDSIVSPTEAGTSGTNTTTSTTDVAMPSMSLSTGGAGTFMVWGSMSIEIGTADESVFISLYVDGGLQGTTTREHRRGTVAADIESTLAFSKRVVAGSSVTVEVRWRVTDGTGTVNARTLNMMRVPA